MQAWMVAAASLICGTAQAQAPRPGVPVRYDLRFDNAAHHEAQVSVTWRQVPAGPLRVQMARSSPGRYALHEFAKNVYSVSAIDGAGRPLALTRTDPYGWSVVGHDGTVTVRYTLFGDHGDGTYAQIDRSHAHLNMPATMLWASGYDERPIEVRFHAPDPRWKVATQLAPGREPGTWWAPDLQYLMDSPTELSDFSLRTWDVDGQTIRLAVHHLGTEADVDRFAAKVKRVVAQHAAVWGGLPRYDNGSYTFIADYLPWATGDGMEHRNSTVIVGTDPLAPADTSQLDTASHEFFHQWNVERLRPAGLEPFDFTRANPSPSLWFAEGFTSYYGVLMVHRAGESTIDALLATLGRETSGLLASPARRYGTPQEMSLRAPFVDAAKSIDPTNPNIYVSYYGYGAVLALTLDLTLRTRPGGHTLDDYMRQLWRQQGQQEKPYTAADLERGLADLTGDAQFARSFFAASIEGSALPDLAPLLDRAGLTLRTAKPGRGYVGAAAVSAKDGVLVLDAASIPGTPLYTAGMERGDVLVSVGGAAMVDPAAWQGTVDRLGVGDRAEIVFRQRGVERRATLVAVADPSVEIVRSEAAGRPLTPAQHAFRTAWLGPSSSAASRSGKSTRSTRSTPAGTAPSPRDSPRPPHRSSRRRSSGSR